MKRILLLALGLLLSQLAIAQVWQADQELAIAVKLVNRTDLPAELDNNDIVAVEVEAFPSQQLNAMRYTNFVATAKDTPATLTLLYRIVSDHASYCQFTLYIDEDNTLLPTATSANGVDCTAHQTGYNSVEFTLWPRTASKK